MLVLLPGLQQKLPFPLSRLARAQRLVVLLPQAPQLLPRLLQQSSLRCTKSVMLSGLLISV